MYIVHIVLYKKTKPLTDSNLYTEIKTKIYTVVRFKQHSRTHVIHYFLVKIEPLYFPAQ